MRNAGRQRASQGLKKNVSKMQCMCVSIPAAWGFALMAVETCC